jgi:hypothetical protein
MAMSGHPSSTDDRPTHNNNSPEAFVSSSPTGAWIFLSPPDANHEMTYYPRLHVLPNGHVICTNPVGPSSHTQRFKPTSGEWFDITTGPPDGFYNGFAGTSVLLPLLHESGYRPRVLLCGGRNPLLIDLGAGSPTWRNTSARTLSGSPQRFNVNCALLPTGDVFVCGGVSQDNGGGAADESARSVLAAELYNPETDRWSTLPSATVVRNYHSVALLMPDGRVWTAGSNHNGAQSFNPPGSDNRELRIEIFEPDYFSASRPQITAAPDRMDYGQTFEVRTPQAASIRRVVLIRAGSSTHSFNPDQRYVTLQFTQSGQDRLSVTAPPDNNIAPPGYYLLFIVDASRIPSEGKFVRFNPVVSGGNPTLIQSRFGAKGNFEVVTPLTTTGLAHHWRSNDNPSLPWNGPRVFGTAAGHVDTASMIQSNFGNDLEVVARVGDRLIFLWRDSSTDFNWSGPAPFGSTGASGNPSLIQSRFGRKGNFELVVPRASTGFDFYFRDNDAAGLPWHGPVGVDTTGGRHMDALCLIQSNFGTPGNLEVVARIGDRLAHYWRDSGPGFVWHGPFFFGSPGVSGNPSFIQSRFGRKGNFELVVPLASGGLAFYWRNNDDPALPWSAPMAFGTSAGRVETVSLIQSNFGSPGNLEVVARIGDRLAHFWRDSGPGFVWQGPFFFAPPS